eukprot:1195248-Prorocentrum_minimum.AAC.4
MTTLEAVQENGGNINEAAPTPALNQPTSLTARVHTTPQRPALTTYEYQSKSLDTLDTLPFTVVGLYACPNEWTMQSFWHQKDCIVHSFGYAYKPTTVKGYNTNHKLY